MIKNIRLYFRKYQKIWRRKNKEKVRFWVKKWKSKHKKEIRIYGINYYNKNKKRLSKKHKIYWEKYRKQGRKLNRQWISQNIKKRRQYMEIYRKRNHHLIQLYKHRRQILEKRGGELKLKTIQRIYENNIKKYKTLTCYLCLKSIPFGKDHLEHKIPISRGGTNQYKNLAVACSKCNFRKNNKTDKEFIKLSV